MAEWSIASVLKTDVLRGTGGSNPSLRNELNQEIGWVVFLFDSMIDFVMLPIATKQVLNIFICFITNYLQRTLRRED